MTSRRPEIERTYEVTAGAELPDLMRLPKVVAVEPVLQSTLEAVYCDTPELALATAGITLRRRTGGSDAGWHLKLPQGGDDRAELAEPLRDDDHGVPPELLAHLGGWVRDRELRPVATLTTRRVVHRLIGDAGKVLAEVSDDLVTANATPELGAVRASSWREWEIELVDGSRKLLQAADALFADAGATPSAWPSKLHHALHQESSVLPRPGMTTADSDDGKATAGAVVAAYIAAQLATMTARDGDVRRSAPDAVHKVRVATRRLRSVLSSYRPLFDRTVTDPVRAELSWYASVLGGVRDAEVQRLHLLEAVAAEPPDTVLGPVASRIQVELGAQYRTAHDALLEAMQSRRYFRLLDSVEQLVAAPPFTDLAGRKARRVLTKRVRSTCNSLYRLACADAPLGDEAKDHWLHEVRKSAKRVRYAAELAEPALGRKAAALANAAEGLQETLGNHQDSVVVRATLRDIGVRMHLDGQNPFTLGRLHAFQQVRAEASEAEFRQAWSTRLADQFRAWDR